MMAGQHDKRHAEVLMMFKVYDKGSFCEGYKLLAILNDPDIVKDCDKRLVDEYAVEIKRELRKWANRSNAIDLGKGYYVERRMIVSDYDGYLELVTLPEGIDTEEHADSFFKAFLYIERPNSMYDCTGRAFTNWYKLFKRNGEFYAYHSVGMDV